MNESHATYLEKLRRSGKTNMFGAAPYLAKEFGIPQNEAGEILGEWMRTYRPPEAKEK